MNKKQTLMAALAGAALLMTLQARAQISYNTGDLLLNFRNVNDSGDGTVNGPEVVVDLGPASTFAGLTGVTDLDPNTGTGKFTASSLQTAFAANGLANVGFSAAATTEGIVTPNAFYVTTFEATAGTYTSASSYPNGTVSSTGQNNFANAINGVGTGAAGASTDGTSFLSALGGLSTSQAVKEGSDTFNYGGQATTGSQPTVISYGGVSTAVSLESSQYAALWNVPQKNLGTATELGYFTFNDSTGDITYTSDLASVPEPSTYGLMAGIGLLALVFRRQLRSVTA
jgi:hypothetical protein